MANFQKGERVRFTHHYDLSNYNLVPHPVGEGTFAQKLYKADANNWRPDAPDEIAVVDLDAGGSVQVPVDGLTKA